MPPRIAPTRGSAPTRGVVSARGGRGGAVSSIPQHITTVGVRRPGYGTGGRIVNTTVNAFRTTITDGIIYHYDAISSDKLPSRFNMELFARLQKVIAPQIFVTPAVYDGRKNAFSMQRLALGPENSASFDVTLKSEGPANSDRPPKAYTFKLTLVAQINTEVLHRFIQAKQSSDNDVLTAITALNIVIRMQPNQNYPFNVRSFFSPNGKQDIGSGLELWRGYFQSVRPSKDYMYINLDIATGVMYKPGPLLGLCIDHMKVRGPEAFTPRDRNFDVRPLNKFVAGMRITTSYTGSTKTFVVKRITQQAASQITFKNSDNVTVSVANFFRAKLGKALQFPDIVCVEVGTKEAKIPLELCMVPPGQFMRKQIAADKTTAMIEFSKLGPRQRLQAIKDGLNVLQYGQSEYIRAFGMNINTNPLSVKARILPPPVLEYGKTSGQPTIKPENGSWNMVDKRFYQPCKIHTFAILLFESAQTLTMLQNFLDAAAVVGITIADKKPVVQTSNPGGDIKVALQQIGSATLAAKHRLPDVILVILPEGSNQIYTAVKHFGDVTHGIITQCLKKNKCAPGKPQYWANVMLKINVKLGGVNNIMQESFLNDPRNPTIVMGADVMHPAPGAEGRPSYASLVSSVDNHTARYVAFNSVQTGRQEIISDLQSMVSQAVAKWLSYSKVVNNRPPPRRLLFYRDGVSEGQFAQVLEHELKMIQDACKANGVNPKITLIIVGKRHHIRMFPQSPADADHRSQNCLAGTTIDQGIGHPTEFDYYQLTHGGILGTSRPAHYSVLHDDNDFTADALQRMSFALCHVYARATRSVSIPAPVYYADIVCARAKNHYAPGFDLEESSTTTSSSAGPQLDLFKANYQPLHEKLVNKMYFM